MSTVVPTPVACPHCETRFEVDLYRGLHATRVPAARQAILDATYQRFACPACRGAVLVEPTFIYTDFDRHHWLGVFERGQFRHRGALTRAIERSFHRNMRVACPPLVRAWADRFTVRVVFGLAALREKLLCFDHGVDDRRLEALKLRLMLRRPGGLTPHDEAWLHDVGPDALVLDVIPADAPGERVSVPREALAVLADEEAEMRAALPWLYEGALVDWRHPLLPDEPLPGGAPGELYGLAGLPGRP